ncbi:hypothetical protein FPV67DRAFT_1076544 [Lyophyllum atratum]|nr:hypothetical protein FPV67DRAFT_1076544 [Lyophyllum atratum]
MRIRFISVARRPYRSSRFARNLSAGRGEEDSRDIIEIHDGCIPHRVWFTRRILRTIFARAGNGVPLDTGTSRSPRAIDAYIEYRYYEEYFRIFNSFICHLDIHVSSHDDATTQQAYHDARQRHLTICKYVYKSIPTPIRLQLIRDDLTPCTTPLPTSDSNAMPCPTQYDLRTAAEILAMQGQIARFQGLDKKKRGKETRGLQHHEGTRPRKRRRTRRTHRSFNSALVLPPTDAIVNCYREFCVDFGNGG